ARRRGRRRRAGRRRRQGTRRRGRRGGSRRAGRHGGERAAVVDGVPGILAARAARGGAPTIRGGGSWGALEAMPAARRRRTSLTLIALAVGCGEAAPPAVAAAPEECDDPFVEEAKAETKAAPAEEAKAETEVAQAVAPADGAAAEA